MEVALDQVILSMLERGNLSRAEIGRVTSVVNVSKDLSRLGKLAANLGHKVAEVGKHNEHEDFSRLQPMAIAVSHLCRQTLRSLSRLDPVLAHNAAQSGASVDAYRDYVLRGPSGRQSRATDEQNLHLIFASRCLEQIADHAIHLAENLVTFLANDEEPQDRRPLAS
jgi:phosphate uptake regulator